MLFNSIHFALFLPVVWLLYWFAAKNKLQRQNRLLLLASLYFYASWDWRFLLLLSFSILLDYASGIQIERVQKKSSKKIWLILSIGINLGFLGIFKYFNFFSETFADACHLMGFKTHPLLLNVVLPVGISFYTFHGLSYVIDIYYQRIKAEKNLVDYALFVSFFPLLVAGPIERATHLLPQLKKVRTFDYKNSVNGLRQILWGLFKKMVIADQCADFADTIFNHYAGFSGSTRMVGAFFFTIQIYCDFSGYSDMALGIARLLGIDLLRNFAFPYFSRNMAEFWRRWHISLSSWFRDYVYIPLGGSKGNTFTKIRNVFIIFLLSGFWHGANFTFIFWGLLNALFILPSVIFKSNRNYMEIVAKGRTWPTLGEFTSMFITFCLAIFAWIFFRSPNLNSAFNYLNGIFSSSLFSKPEIFPKLLLLQVGIMIFIEWLGREQQYGIERFASKWPRILRWGFYYVLILTCIYYAGVEKQFIYFQF